MTKHLTLIALAALSSVGFSGAALAQSTMATATTELNIRSGPGPHFPSVGFIAAGDSATVEGCLDASKWCQVTANGVSGWSYSDYLTADVSGRAVVLTDRSPTASIATVTYQDDGSAAGGAVAGAATGAVVGALVGGPVGAIVGGAVGTTSGATAGAIIDPPEVARTYVTANPLDPVYLDGEVVIGAGTRSPCRPSRITSTNMYTSTGSPCWLTPAPVASSTSFAKEDGPAYAGPSSLAERVDLRMMSSMRHASHLSL